MPTSHRKPTRREVRRAQERQNVRRISATRKAAVAAGAVVASASLAFGPAVAQAEQLTTVPNAENDYSTWNNLIVIADSLGRTQGAILAPIGQLTPEGTLPTIGNTKDSKATELTFIDGIGQGASALLQQPNTGHVPGAGGILGAGALVAMLPQGLAGVPVATAAAQSLTILPKTTSTLAALGGLDGTTLSKNLTARATGLLGDKVVQDGGFALEALNIGNDPLSLLGLPGVHRQTDSWNNSYDWPLLQLNGKTWIVQDRITVDPVTSEELKKKYADRIGTLDTLKVQKGKTTRPVTGYEVQVVKDKSNCAYEFVSIGPLCGVTTYKTVFGVKIPIGFDNKPWGSKTESLPVYGPLQFVPDADAVDAAGNPIYTTIYDPNAGVLDALTNLDGINIPGFSLIKREAGGEYNFLGDGSLGWLTSTTQVIADGKVVTVPLVAGGIALPYGLLTTGGMYTPGMVTQNGQTTSAVLGTRSRGFAIPALGLGVDTTSILESWQIGPDGIAYNSGWTIGLAELGIGVPIPLLYSLGSVNLGPKGIGYTSPSFFGVGLPSFQLGQAPGSSQVDAGVLGGLTAALGGTTIPSTIFTLDPKTLFALANITDPTGLGLTDPFGTAQAVLSPLFTQFVTPGATVVAQSVADLGSKATNTLAEQNKRATGTLGEITTKVAETSEDTSDKTVDGLADIQQRYPIEVNKNSTETVLNENPVVVEPQGDAEVVEPPAESAEEPAVSIDSE